MRAARRLRIDNSRYFGCRKYHEYRILRKVYGTCATYYSQENEVAKIIEICQARFLTDGIRSLLSFLFINLHTYLKPIDRTLYIKFYNTTNIFFKHSQEESQIFQNILNNSINLIK